jgi:hypothetical protein
MQPHDAYALLTAEMAAYRELRYDDLVQLVGETSSKHLRAADSTQYLIEINVSWRTGAPGEILVKGMAATADFGPLRRLDDSFLASPPSVPSAGEAPLHDPS